MAIRMLFVAGLGGYVKTIQGYTTCYHIYDAFQCIGKYSYRMRDIKSYKLCYKQNKARNGYPFLNLYGLSAGIVYGCCIQMYM